MIHKSIYFCENITKIPTLGTISPYLQALKITNKPRKPILIKNMYMPTHQEDIYLLKEIQNQIQLVIRHHSRHQIILAKINSLKERHPTI